MTLRGESARVRCREAVTQLGELIPPDVAVSISGDGGQCIVTAQKNIRAQDFLPPPGFRGTVTMPGGLHAEFAIFGFGAWIPLLPRRLKTRLALADVVETIQSAVSGASGSPWPGEGYEVRSTTEGDRVRVWFADSEGGTLPAVTFETTDDAG